MRKIIHWFWKHFAKWYEVGIIPKWKTLRRPEFKIVNHFSKKKIRRYFEQNGYEVISIRRIRP